MTTVEILLTLATVFSANYGTKLLDYAIERRKARRSQDNNMDEDFRRQTTIKPLLEDLKYQLDACRVLEVGFSNGDTTLGGYHMKKVSVITETDPDPGEELIAPHFQLIPAKKFDRTLGGLFESADDYALWHELKETDHTAVLNRAFDFNTILMVTIRDGHNKWVGYLFVSWKDEDHQVSQAEIERVKLVAARIGAMGKK